MKQDKIGRETTFHSIWLAFGVIALVLLSAVFFFPLRQVDEALQSQSDQEIGQGSDNTQFSVTETETQPEAAPVAEIEEAKISPNASDTGALVGTGIQDASKGMPIGAVPDKKKGEGVAAKDASDEVLAAKESVGNVLLDSSVDWSDPEQRARAVARMKDAEDRDLAEAIATAKELGEPLREKLPDGGLREVAGLDDDGELLYFETKNVNAAISTGANLLQTSPFSLDGAGIRVGVWDGGSVLSTHQEFNEGTSSRVNTRDGAASNYHATHVGGTIAAFGVVPNAKGMATQALIESYDWFSDTSEMTAAAAFGVGQFDNKVYLSNHSYGYSYGWRNSNGVWIWTGIGTDQNAYDADFGQYSSASRNLDSLVYNSPYYVIFWSAGNESTDGPGNGQTCTIGGASVVYNPSIHPQNDGDYSNGFDTIGDHGVSKNLITMGAAYDAVSGGQRDPSRSTIVSFSSTGPVDDGRIKPDLVANGVSLYSSDNGNDTNYRSLSGTSMSSPNASGSAALLIDLYRDLFSGNAMRGSTLRGLLIHTATDIGNPGPDYTYGWGLMDAKKAAEHIQREADFPGLNSIIEGHVSDTQSSQSYSFSWDGVSPIRATLCWNDPAGAAQNGHNDRVPDLVNNLNLKLTAPDGSTQYLPFVMPFVGTWTQASMSQNAVIGVNNTDNVEQVLVESPGQEGNWQAEVTYTGNLTNGAQDFGLLISGAGVVGSLSFGADSYTVDEDAGAAIVTVNRVGGSTGAVGVSYLTQNGSALAGSDYAATSGTLSWADGEDGAKTISIPVINDGDSESYEETLSVMLSNPSGGIFISGTDVASLTIVDDEPSLGITAPNGGEVLSVNSQYDITWASSFVGLVRIDLLRGELLFQTLAASTENDGVFEWSVPVSIPNGSDYSIRISLLGGGGLSDSSNATFTVENLTEVDIYAPDMSSDPGWTLQGNWAYGIPAGGGGQYGNSDPTSGNTGNHVIGYNLAGDYENNIGETYATTPAIDCSGSSDVQISFYRWLNVETDQYDKAAIRISNDGVNWTEIWSNSGQVTDSSWVEQTFDISAVADGEATVYVRWVMGATDRSWQFSGWNIDDVIVSGLSEGVVDPVMVQVPGLIGLAQSAAEAGITGANLTVGTITSVYSNTVPAGNVISQNPGSGSSVLTGSPVDLVVSLGVETVPVPDVAGLAQGAAESAITGSGLTVGAVTTAFSNTVPAGNVISQNPGSGSSVAIGSSVNLVVSLGVEMITVPNVAGLVQASAEATLTGAGLTVGAVTTTYSDTVAAGNVISQGTAAGTSVVIGAAVDLLVSDGSEPNTPPVVDAGADQTATLAGASWSPDSLIPALWLDASDTATITQGEGTVSQWSDKSGNNRHATQGTGGSQPTLTSGGLNGMDVLNFDGSSDFLNVDLNFMAGGDHSVFVVTRTTNHTDIYGAANGRSGSRSLHVGYRNSSSYRMNYWRNDWYSTISANNQSRSANLLNFVWQTRVSKEIFANGNSEGSTSNAGLIRTMAGGGRISNVVGHGFYGGDIAEFIAFDRALTPAERQAMEGYLAHKWGTEELLDTAHPHKATGPDGVSAEASLDATVTDGDDDPVSYNWSVVSGPGTVEFGNASAEDTTATFTLEGTYVLRLTVDDGTDTAFDEVTITVDPLLLAVPDLVGLTQSAAESALTAAGFAVGTVGTEYSDTVAAGEVISQGSAPGSPLAGGSAVDFIVSLGSLGSETVIVPNVVGLNQSSAVASIAAAQLTVGSITSEYSSTVPAGDVISQGLNAGASVPISSALDLVVSLGIDSSPKLLRTTVSSVSNSSWTSVNLGTTYNSPVIIATPIYPDNTKVPVVTRITNVTSTGFDVKIDRADGQTDPVSVDVSIIVVDEGAYTQAADGVTMEAVKYTSTVTARKGRWAAESRSFQNSYINPIVVGQVMSTNDSNWSVFWSMGNARRNPVNATNLNVGKHIGEDPNTSRADETVGYIVIESGSGSISGIAYEAGIGADNVRGIGNSRNPYSYSLSGSLPSASAAAVSIGGMDGGDGGWAVLGGSPAFSPTSIRTWINEDVLKDSERSHTTEQVGYLIFE